MTNIGGVWRRVSRYLELDDAQLAIAGIVDPGSDENDDPRRRQSCLPSAQTVCNKIYSDVLQQFGQRGIAGRACEPAPQ